MSYPKPIHYIFHYVIPISFDADFFTIIHNVVVKTIAKNQESLIWTKLVCIQFQDMDPVCMCNIPLRKLFCIFSFKEVLESCYWLVSS